MRFVLKRFPFIAFMNWNVLIPNIFSFDCLLTHLCHSTVHLHPLNCSIFRVYLQNDSNKMIHSVSRRFQIAFFILNLNVFTKVKKFLVIDLEKYMNLYKYLKQDFFLPMSVCISVTYTNIHHYRTSNLNTTVGRHPIDWPSLDAMSLLQMFFVVFKKRKL